MSDLCAVTSDLIRQDRREATAAKRERFVELEVDRMTSAGGEYEPMTPSNFAQALAEIGEHPQELMHILAQFAAGRDHAVGIYLRHYSATYWTKVARREAERAAAQATCSHCYDVGCNRCSREEF